MKGIALFALVAIVALCGGVQAEGSLSDADALLALPGAPLTNPFEVTTPAEKETVVAAPSTPLVLVNPAPAEVALNTVAHAVLLAVSTSSDDIKDVAAPEPPKGAVASADSFKATRGPSPEDAAKAKKAKEAAAFLANLGTKDDLKVKLSTAWLKKVQEKLAAIEDTQDSLPRAKTAEERMRNRAAKALRKQLAGVVEKGAAILHRAEAGKLTDADLAHLRKVAKNFKGGKGKKGKKSRKNRKGKKSRKSRKGKKAAARKAAKAKAKAAKAALKKAEVALAADPKNVQLLAAVATAKAAHKAARKAARNGKKRSPEVRAAVKAVKAAKKALAADPKNEKLQAALATAKTAAKAAKTKAAKKEAAQEAKQNAKEAAATKASEDEDADPFNSKAGRIAKKKMASAIKKAKAASQKKKDPKTLARERRLNAATYGEHAQNPKHKLRSLKAETTAPAPSSAAASQLQQAAGGHSSELARLSGKASGLHGLAHHGEKVHHSTLKFDANGLPLHGEKALSSGHRSEKARHDEKAYDAQFPTGNANGPSTGAPKAFAPPRFQQVGAEADSEMEAELDAEAEADAEAEVEAEVEAEIDAEAEADADMEAEADADMEAEAETENFDVAGTVDALMRTPSTGYAGQTNELGQLCPGCQKIVLNADSPLSAHDHAQLKAAHADLVLGSTKLVGQDTLNRAILQVDDADLLRKTMLDQYPARQEGGAAGYTPGGDVATADSLIQFEMHN